MPRHHGDHHHDHARHERHRRDDRNWAKSGNSRPREAGAGAQLFLARHHGRRAREQWQQGRHPILADLTVAGVQLSAHAINPFLEPPPYGPARDTQGARDIRRRSAMKKAKHEGLAKRLFECRHCLGHGAMDLGITNQFLGTCDRAGVCRRRGQLATLATVRTSPKVDRQIACHAGQPRAPGVRGRALPGRDQGFLNDVLGGVQILHERHGKPSQPSCMKQEIFRVCCAAGLHDLETSPRRNVLAIFLGQNLKLCQRVGVLGAPLPSPRRVPVSFFDTGFYDN